MLYVYVDSFRFVCLFFFSNLVFRTPYRLTQVNKNQFLNLSIEPLKLFTLKPLMQVVRTRMNKEQI